MATTSAADFSNINAAYDATDDKIAELAMREGSGELARCEFLAHIATAFREGTLRYDEPKKTKTNKGPTESDHAKHALRIWAAYRATTMGEDIRPVKSSRVSELGVILRASHSRRDIVQAAVRVSAQLAKDTAEDEDKYTAKSYDAILRVAREQVRVSKEANKPIGMSDAEIRAHLLEKKPDATEDERVETVMKAIEKLGADFPNNKDIYIAIGAGFEQVLAELKRRRERADDEAEEERLRAKREAREQAERPLIEATVVHDDANTFTAAQ
jgi:hypothetical protein